MTEEHSGMPEPPQPPEFTEPVAGDSRSAMFSSSEGMVTLGGAVIIAGYLIFGVIFNEYWTGSVALLAAILAVLLPRANRGFVEKIAPLSTLMKAVGYIIGIWAVVELVENIRFANSAIDSFPEILGALVLFGGSAIAYMGARSIEN